MENTGQRIRRLRKERGIERQSELCALVPDLGQSTLSDIESKNKSFSASVLLGLARALKVSPDYIVSGVGEEDLGTVEIVELFKTLSQPAREMLLIAARGLVANASAKKAAEWPAR